MMFPNNIINNFYNKIMMYDEFIIFDVETTGFSFSKDRIFQFCAIKLQYQNGIYEVTDEVNIYINPQKEIPEAVSELTGMSNDKVISYPLEKEVFQTIAAFINNKVVVAYNSNFDIKMMEAMFERNKSTFKYMDEIDLLPIARVLTNDVRKSNNKLGTIANLYGFESANFHNAYVDVEAELHLFRCFIESANNFIEDSINIKKQVPSVTSIRYYEGYKGNNRIYINTPIGSYYYDIIRKGYDAKEGSHPLNDIDIDSLEKSMLNFAGVKSIDKLVKKYKQ